jgi:hypothetical protein
MMGRVRKSSLVGLADGRQITTADHNLRVHAEHSTPKQQAHTHADADSGSDMPCRGDVVAVVLELGTWYDLPDRAVLGPVKGKD